MQCWRARHQSRNAVLLQLVKRANDRRLRVAFKTWAMKLKGKRQADWRDDMRSRMKLVRGKRENRLRKDAWAKWRQSYQSHLSVHRYNEQLVLRIYIRWKTRLSEVEQQEAVADEFLCRVERGEVERCWQFWRKASDIAAAEQVILERVGLRVMGEVLDVWRKRMYVHQTFMSHENSF
jgi:protein SFI1